MFPTVRGAHVNTSSIKTAQLQGENELLMFQGSASNICSWNYSIKLRTNDKFQFASKGRIVSWLYFDLGQLWKLFITQYDCITAPTTLMKDMVWHISWVPHSVSTDWMRFSTVITCSLECAVTTQLPLSACWETIHLALSVLPVLSSSVVCIILGSSNSLWRTNPS